MTKAEKTVRDVLSVDEKERRRMIFGGSRKGRKRLSIVVWYRALEMKSENSQKRKIT